jgi:hypothetical protein
VPRSYKETSGARIRAGVSKPPFREDFEHGSRGIAIVGAVTKQLLVKTL